MKALSSTITAFLKSKSDLSVKTKQKYSEGTEALREYIDGYARGKYSSSSPLGEITLNDIDYLLGYHLIRRYTIPTSFLLNTARVVGSFFTYAADISLYNANDAKIIKAMARYYSGQYPRLESLQSALWGLSEGEVNRVMKLPKKQQEAAIKVLQQGAVGSTIKDVGYVDITRIDGEYIFGNSLTISYPVGPVKIDEASKVHLQIGDIINMGVVCKLKNDSFWEIAELGNVHPRPYLGFWK